uniref:Plant disease resistance polyprotein-like n=1 Tax=Oryza sativa subsp. japonica TaxID=39947 RepID=Q6YWL1_ORYSJ|nr:plant disease resistance polyprotein-like [Oryza sativa Japonica Group]BAD10620.1 plant disease resistance polyprotein-like [Oryza sativa Japonica Group]
MVLRTRQAGDQVFGSVRRDYSLFVNVYFVFINMSNTGDNNNTGDKKKEVPVNTNGGNTVSKSSGGGGKKKEVPVNTNGGNIVSNSSGGSFSGADVIKGGCGADMRGPPVSGSGEREKGRRQAGPTRQRRTGGRSTVDRDHAGGPPPVHGIDGPGRPGADRTGGGTRASTGDSKRRRGQRQQMASQRRRRPKATASAGGGDARGIGGRKGKGEGVLTRGDSDDRRRGATEGGRQAADGDWDDLKNEKEKITEGERGHRRRERRPKAADMATLTVARALKIPLKILLVNFDM